MQIIIIFSSKNEWADDIKSLATGTIATHFSGGAKVNLMEII